MRCRRQCPPAHKPMRSVGNNRRKCDSAQAYQSSTPATQSCHSDSAGGDGDPAANIKLPDKAGQKTPMRSDNRPRRMPPTYPSIVSIYAIEAAPRPVSNSIATGFLETTVYIPEPPMVISASDANRRTTGYADDSAAFCEAQVSVANFEACRILVMMTSALDRPP